MRARDPRCAQRSSLPAVHPRAPSLPTDSPFRMSHCCASKHWRGKKVRQGQHIRRVRYTTNTWRSFYLTCLDFQTTGHPGWNGRECALARGNPRRVQPCERQMCLQDVPRDWVCNPSSPLLPSPFPLILADDNTAANSNPSPRHGHAQVHAFSCLPGQTDVSGTERGQPPT